MPDNNGNNRVSGFALQVKGFDAAHYATTERYAKQVERLYATAADEYARLGASITDPGDAGFSFDKFPKARKQAQGIATRLAQRLETVIGNGVRSEWLAACKKNDAFVNSILHTSRLTKEEAEQYMGRNLEALKTFQGRKVQGLDLSQRVWKYVGDFKEQMELGIDVGLGEGKSAQELSRDLRRYLQEPERLYRRVRDKHGVLRLSKAASLYHPGQGVYRSSAKNAARLTRTEINMAYRESDWLRWQQLDFVVGIRVCLSNNHTTKDSKGKTVPLTDMCDDLYGDYPKTFKFTGWHPQCRCYVVPILSDYDEYNKDRANRLKAIVKKQEYKAMPSRRTVKDVPTRFRDYIDSISDRAKGWKSMPYYIRDNFKGGTIEGGLKGEVPTQTMNTVEPCTEYDEQIKHLRTWAYALGLDLSAIEPLRNAGNRAALETEIERLRNIGEERQNQWRTAWNELKDFANNKAQGIAEIVKEAETVLKANEVRTNNYYDKSVNSLKTAVSNLLAKIKAGLTPTTQFTTTTNKLKALGVDHKEVKELPSGTTEAQIIDRVSGGDNTEGSCASVALAYAGNKAGLDVLDYRDGESRNTFALRSTWRELTKQLGGNTATNKNDFTTTKELLNTAEKNKEYILVTGGHASVVKKTDADGWQYLELQSETQNGYKPLNKEVLKLRFGCKASHTIAGKKYEVEGFIIPLDKFKGGDSGLKDLLGYINTSEGQQNKGIGGTPK